MSSLDQEPLPLSQAGFTTPSCTCPALGSGTRSATMHLEKCPVRIALNAERLHQLTLGASRDLQYAKRKLAEAQAKFEAASRNYNAFVLDFCTTEDVL